MIRMLRTTAKLFPRSASDWMSADPRSGSSPGLFRTHFLLERQGVVSAERAVVEQAPLLDVEQLRHEKDERRQRREDARDDDRREGQRETVERRTAKQHAFGEAGDEHRRQAEDQRRQAHLRRAEAAQTARQVGVRWHEPQIEPREAEQNHRPHQQTPDPSQEQELKQGHREAGVPPPGPADRFRSRQTPPGRDRRQQVGSRP